MASPRRAWFAGAAIATLVVAACGAGQPGTSLAPSDSVPATASPPLPTSPATTPGSCPNYVEVVETGPMPTDFSEDGPMGLEQGRLQADVEAASAYGAAHPDEFASIRYENAPRVRIVIGFTARIEEHCEALRASLEFPDEFEIILQPATEAQLDQIQQELVRLAGDKLRSAGRGAGVLHLALRADGEDVAADVLAAYGDLVEITVGMLPYPNRFAGDVGCRELPNPILDAALVARATLDTTGVRSGGDFGGTVTVTNVGEAPFDLQSGIAVALVSEPGSDRPIGYYTGAIADVGLGGLLQPGDTFDIQVIGGTASCNTALGYALPPGAYEVRVPVVLLAMHDNAPTEVSYLLSAPVPLTVFP